MIIRKNRKKNFKIINFYKNLKNIFSYRLFMISVIFVQFMIILFFIIFLVPRQNFFYAVNTNYETNSAYMRIIKSLGYISTSVISSLKLKMGLIDTDLNIKMKTSDYAKLMFLRNQAYTDESRRYVE